MRAAAVVKRRRRKKMGREEVYNRYYEKNEVVRYLVPGVLRYQVLIPGTAEERDVCRSRRKKRRDRGIRKKEQKKKLMKRYI